MKLPDDRDSEAITAIRRGFRGIWLAKSVKSTNHSCEVAILIVGAIWWGTYTESAIRADWLQAHLYGSEEKSFKRMLSWANSFIMAAELQRTWRALSCKRDEKESTFFRRSDVARNFKKSINSPKNDGDCRSSLNSIIWHKEMITNIGYRILIENFHKRTNPNIFNNPMT